MDKRKIVISYDGSDSARFAVNDLGRSGLSTNNDATVVTCAELWMPPPPSYGLAEGPFDGALQSVVATAQETCNEGIEAVRAQHPTWTVDSVVSIGSPATEVLRVAEEKGASLIVTGTHGRTGPGRILLGSVSSKLVTHATCSVRVARASTLDPGSSIRIVLAIDGSPGSREALEEICRRTWPSGTEVKLVTAVGPFGNVRDEIDAELDRVNSVQSQAEEHLRAANLGVSSTIREEDPRTLLVREAEEWNADCIFLGATGFASWTKALFGHVPAAVVPRAHCSVEVVREGPPNEQP